MCGVRLRRNRRVRSTESSVLCPKETLRERLDPARTVFGSWTLRELEGAAADIASWRATLSATSRYRLTAALRQALAAAVR